MDDQQDANRERFGSNAPEKVPEEIEGRDDVRGTGAPQAGAHGNDIPDTSNLIPGDKGPRRKDQPGDLD